MRSMTGCGTARSTIPEGDIAVEITGVNRKGLEINVHLPKDWQSLESLFIDQIRKNLQRGRIHVSITYKPLLNNQNLAWKNPVVTDAINNLKELSLSHGISFTCTPELLFRVVNTLSNLKPFPELTDNLKLTLEACVLQAFHDFQKFCHAEGALLKNDFLKRIELLHQLFLNIEMHSKTVVPRYQETLLARLKQIGLDIDLGDERVLKEIAVFADRSDVSEELTRFQAHLEQFREILNEPVAIGRKLDFLCQELLRELNTISSKANALAITRLVIEAKNELERIREQAQNIE
jgi:uncharacterized protein (TIGR00255 family)